MDKIGYLRTIAATNIPVVKLTLLILALNSDDLLIGKRKISKKMMAARSQCSPTTAVRHIESLETQGLIKSIEVKRKKYWQLPSETQLMTYRAPAKKPRKKRPIPEGFGPLKKKKTNP